MQNIPLNIISLKELCEKTSAKDKYEPGASSSLNEAMDEIICAIY